MNKFLQKTDILRNEVLSKHTTMRIGGKCDYFFEPKTIKDFVNAIKFCKKTNKKYYILGNGSKVIFSDSGFFGFVICTKGLNKISSKYTIVKVSCGVNLFALNNFLANKNLSGLEFTYGIPGTVGGAVCMNAGANDGEIGSFVQKVKIFDGKKTRIIKQKDLNFVYRDSLIKQKSYVVLCVWLKLKKGNKTDIQNKCKEYMSKRKLTQPLESFNSGSIFKKTNGIIAGKIIDKIGLKGVKINGAQISTLHANFIINNGKATCKDVVELINLVRQKVYGKTGVWLDEEIIIVGEEKWFCLEIITHTQYIQVESITQCTQKAQYSKTQCSPKKKAWKKLP